MALNLPHAPDCPACLDPGDSWERHLVDRTSPEYLAWAEAWLEEHGDTLATEE